VKKYIYIGIILALVLGGYLAVNAIFTPAVDIPTATARRGDMVISLNENGTVNAKRAMTLSSPRIRSLTITWLAPEGSTVKEGDPVIRFDATQQLADLQENQSSLKIAQTALERANKEYTIQEKQLTLDLEKARRNHLEKKHEAPLIAEEAKMELDLAELNFQAKLEQLRSDVQKAELEVQRAQEKVNQAQRELDQMTVAAPIPGLVVYLEIWKGSSMGKVQEGDAPWPGQGLVNLPDLSDMMVETTVSEVDANKVDTGQEVVVTLDAFPEVQFQGRVAQKSTLARKKEQNSKINVFDIEVDITQEDPRLKPGMSAACKIVVDRLQDVVSVPLEAVFERDDTTVVFLKDKKKRPVAVGRRNDMFIEVRDGLRGGEEICLVDPTVQEQGLPGDRATEPELNRDRTAAPSAPPAGGEGRRTGGGRRGGS